MNFLRPNAPLAELIIELLCALSLAIVFLQSGIDKLVDRKGNLDYFTKQFARSTLSKMVPLLLPAITALEVAAGALSGLGVLQLVLGGSHVLAFWGAVVSGVTLVSLLFGLRISKDYGGAAGMVPYLLLAVAAIYFLAKR